jgi:hypothetical protein
MLSKVQLSLAVFKKMSGLLADSFFLPLRIRLRGFKPSVRLQLFFFNICPIAGLILGSIFWINFKQYHTSMDNQRGWALMSGFFVPRQINNALPYHSFTLCLQQPFLEFAVGSLFLLSKK